MKFSQPALAAVLLMLALGVGGAPSIVAAQSAPTGAASQVQVEAGARPLGAPSRAAVPATGGVVTLADGAVTAQVFADPARPPLTLIYQGVDARTLPPAQSGLSLGFGAFQLSALDAEAQTPVTGFSVPINLAITPGASDLALAQGNIRRLRVGTWNGDSWVAVPCSPDAISGASLVCSTTRSGLFVPLVVLPVNPVLDQLDVTVSGGHFYRQGNGFGGGGGLGYSVLDDGDAPLWSEFQRQGGVGRLGYPVTNRFVFDEHVTQAFQKGALLWAPEVGESLLVNVLDELHTHGLDAWLEATHQVPPAPAIGQPADASILAPYPSMLALYEADPNLYGLPIAVTDDGQLASARFQRSTIQVWYEDHPFATGGTALPGTAGDLAKAAGLWPASAATPGGPPAN